jgi:hypothetical protein
MQGQKKRKAAIDTSPASGQTKLTSPAFHCLVDTPFFFSSAKGIVEVCPIWITPSHGTGPYTITFTVHGLSDEPLVSRFVAAGDGERPIPMPAFLVPVQNMARLNNSGRRAELSVVDARGRSWKVEDTKLLTDNKSTNNREKVSREARYADCTTPAAVLQPHEVPAPRSKRARASSSPPLEGTPAQTPQGVPVMPPGPYPLCRECGERKVFTGKVRCSICQVVYELSEAKEACKQAEAGLAASRKDVKDAEEQAKTCQLAVELKEVRARTARVNEEAEETRYRLEELTSTLKQLGEHVSTEGEARDEQNAVVDSDSECRQGRIDETNEAYA